MSDDIKFHCCMCDQDKVFAPRFQSSREMLRSIPLYGDICNGCVDQWGQEPSGPMKLSDRMQLKVLKAATNRLVWEIHNGRYVS